MGRIQIKAEDVLDAPERIAPSPFANFLRYFRRKHPRMDLRRVLREAPVIWRQLTKRQRNLFEKQVWKGKERKLYLDTLSQTSLIYVAAHSGPTCTLST